MRRLVPFLLSSLLLSGSLPAASAQDGSSPPSVPAYLSAPDRPADWLPDWPNPEAPSPLEVPAIHLPAEGMKLDGRLDEAQWRQAARVTGLIRNVPLEGGAGAGPAEAFIFYDDLALWVGARVSQPRGQLRAHLAPRDHMGDDDNVTVGLSPRHDQSAVLLQCNAYGVQADLTLVDDNLSDVWDGIWYSAGQRSESGYTVEFRIPFRSLRFSHAPLQDWGLNISVWTGARGQLDTWPPIARDRGTTVAQFGVLKGLTGIRPGTGLEIIPSLKMQLGYSNLDDASLPATWDRELFRLRDPAIIDPGLDARYGVTSGISLNATLNPDFSQLEADPEQLTYNRRFPLELAEKRPFFLESAEVFATPQALLYSRAIQDPLGGLKLAGKEGRWSAGVLSVWDQTPASSRIDGADCTSPARTSGIPADKAAGQAGGQATGQPGGQAAGQAGGQAGGLRTGFRTGFECPVEDGLDAVTNVVRLAADVAGSSRVGVFFTDKRLFRQQDGGLEAAHDLVAADALLNLSPIYTVTLQGGASRTGLDAAAPLDGQFGRASVLRETSASRLSLVGAWFSPGFRAEAAPLYRTGYAGLEASASYKFLTDRPWLTFVTPELNLAVITAPFPLTVQDWTLSPGVSLHPFGNNDLGFRAYLGQETFAQHAHPVSNAEGWAVISPTGWFQVETTVSGGRRIHYDEADDFDGSGVDGDVALTFRPGAHAGLELGYVKSLLWRDDGRLQASIDLARFKATWNFSARWSLRFLSQARNEAIPLEPEQAHSFVANSLLLTWLASPGTALYLGAQDIEPLNGEGGIDRRLFVKLSYLWH